MNPPSGNPRIARLPIDGPTGLPIPFTATRLPNGTISFAKLDPAKLAAVMQRSLCGVCGQPQGSRKAFIGGYHCTAIGVFFDPPMHRSCAEAALTLCPHIFRGRKVGTESSLDGRVRPEGWYLYITRSYTLTMARTLSERQPPTIAFQAAPPVELHRYHYVDDRLAYDRPITRDELPTSHLTAGES